MTARNKDIRRARGRRQTRRRILITTEGTLTEVQYTEGLVQHLRALGVSVRSVTTRGLGKDPLRVVEEAIRLSNNASADSRFDEVWSMVDVDNHSRLEPALKIAQEHSVRVVVSNPSFEIWLVWHYADHNAHCSTAQLVKLLERNGHSSKKIPVGFPYDEYPNAVKRAEMHPVAHTSIGGNPSSALPELIRSFHV